MDQTRLTCRLPRDILAGAKRYANGYNTTLTRPVSEYLRQPGTQDDPLADAPVVRRLSGALSQDAAVDDYREYLEKKHVGVLACQGGNDHVCG